MTPISRLAFIGNALPRRCGIATFTTDLRQAIADARPGLRTRIAAMNNAGHTYDYPEAVGFEIDDAVLADYPRAARSLNAGGFDAVSLQHEFGIFGGPAGSHIMATLARLNMPVVTTLHTVLAEPSDDQRAVFRGIARISSKLVVMAAKGHELLRSVYQVPAEKIEIIPHGIPDFPFLAPAEAKAELGFAGKDVILTFGLLSPNKGIEVMLGAMPDILKARPNAVYVVLGATHPALAALHGETYRDSLIARARELGVSGQVVFHDQFVDRPTLLRYISMCDVYVTPYLNEAQMTSGTLAYSYGLGKAIVSTPYWHARELLADGRGVLVPFGDSAALGAQISNLLGDDARRLPMCRRAWDDSRSMIWERAAEHYLDLLDRAAATHPRSGGDRPRIVVRPGPVAVPRFRMMQPPEPRFGHLLAMCDDTGLLQHAILSVPDRDHGYCIDDNARALLLATALSAPGETFALPDPLTTRFAAFIQHAWNPANGRFRNFMSYDRRWLEARGSEDSHGRALWALGDCARGDTSPSRRLWASTLFADALLAVDGFTSPRAWAFTLLGLDAYLEVSPRDAYARFSRNRLAGRLLDVLVRTETPDWIWFEEGLAYDNARLPQALIVTGAALARDDLADAGTRTLSWLLKIQTAPSGVFRPVGTAGFNGKRAAPEPFDQQPLEANATISACLAAARADPDPAWNAAALRAFGWFLGTNDLGVPLADAETGGCRDGLHPDRANENMGAESVLSYLLSLVELRSRARAGAVFPVREPMRALSTG